MSNLGFLAGASERQAVRHASSLRRVWSLVAIYLFVVYLAWQASGLPFVTFLWYVGSVALFLVPLVVADFVVVIGKGRGDALPGRLRAIAIVAVAILVALVPVAVLFWPQLTATFGFIRFSLPQMVRLEELTLKQLIFGSMMCATTRFVAAHILFVRGTTVLARRADYDTQQVLGAISAMASNGRDLVHRFMRGILVDIEAITYGRLHQMGLGLRDRLAGSQRPGLIWLPFLLVTFLLVSALSVVAQRFGVSLPVPGVLQPGFPTWQFAAFAAVVLTMLGFVLMHGLFVRGIPRTARRTGGVPPEDLIPGFGQGTQRVPLPSEVRTQQSVAEVPPLQSWDDQDGEDGGAVDTAEMPVMAITTAAVPTAESRRFTEASGGKPGENLVARMLEEARKKGLQPTV